uniref:Uncharacterized protein n=1 Tax=Eustigmatophyceae sp. Bat 8/9-7w TaxID=2506144 RepID=A0A451FM76_9STRA|nr:hypothetical protein Ycf34 [Eustigmatophyceae sp. Bat 8/9-7w]QAA11496.1 hypothetical protein Ycf34 [Eustigmatophyceae sp. Bat 8/9-7w]
MCICINCSFYSTCWINKALLNFPKNYVNLINNVRNLEKIKLSKLNDTYIPIMLEIQLNVNQKNLVREPDIIFCDSFVEMPGKWLCQIVVDVL